jgi:PPM family protein phosphatase
LDAYETWNFHIVFVNLILIHPPFNAFRVVKNTTATTNSILHMTIRNLYAANEIGKRKNLEDSIWPKIPPVSRGSLFIVCDGVGGGNKGEVASEMVCQSLSDYLSKLSIEAISPADIENGVKHAIGQLDRYTEEHPASAGMATTLVLAIIQEKKVLLGWCGDSRIMHIRGGNVIYQTTDHSMVQLLVSQGEISEVEALSHPQKNLILRSINAAGINSITDVEILQDIMEGDWLLLCTDGVLETLRSGEIAAFFAGKQEPADTYLAILDNAKGRTNDNYSFYLIQF